MLKSVLKFCGRTIVYTCCGLTAFDVIGHPAVVTGASMFPTLDGCDSRWWKRDIVWISKWGLLNPARNDIITFTSPRDPSKVHIKRLTANEGELVRPKNHPPMLIPAGTCWMESDNPVNANDSNIYGPVSKGLFRGRAAYVIWPPNHWQRLRD